MANNKERVKIRSSLMGRAFSTVKLSAHLGMGATKQLLNIDPSNPEKAIEVALKLANEFDSLKGLMMKFGQMASYLGTHLPPEAREALAKLQSSSSAMTFDTVREIIEADLGQPIEKCFDEFEETAFAAASIGQVHKAKLNGIDVAVKVQYPDIKRLLSIDLMLVGNLFTAFTASTTMDGKGLAKELKARILEECDYELEAYHQHKIRAAFAGNEDLYVPKVYTNHCGQHTLTTEFIEGIDFKSFCQSTGQEAKNRAALTIFNSSFHAIFRHGFFNGDPHPGNYLFSEEGKVTLLDFGCIKKFDPNFLAKWRTLASSILNQDRDAFPKALKELDMIGNEKRFDYDFHWETINLIYKPFLETEPYAITNEHISEINSALIWKNKNRFSLKIPPDLLFVNRLQWGQLSILADLNACCLWGPHFRAAVDISIEPLFDFPNHVNN